LNEDGARQTVVTIKLNLLWPPKVPLFTVGVVFLLLCVLFYLGGNLYFLCTAECHVFILTSTQY